LDVAAALAAMQSAQTAQQMSIVALKNAAAMQRNVVDLLSQGVEAGKALLPDGVGGVLDRSA